MMNLLPVAVIAQSFYPAVCFSPGGQCDVVMAEWIGSAKKSIDVSIYSFTNEKIANALIQSYRNGINIRIVVDKGGAKSTSSKVNDVKQAGIPVRYGVQEALMHHKFIVIDSKFLETGSFNYTGAAVDKNQENQVYLDDERIVTKFNDQFKVMWEKSQPL